MTRRRRAARVALRWAGLTVLGAVVGVVVGIATPTHVEIAGSDTRIWLRPGTTVDELGVTGLVTLTRATDREVAGEPVGVRAVVDLDASELVRDGELNTDVVPAYVAAYSDPEQLVSDIRHELIWHLTRWLAGGALVVLLLLVGGSGYRRWRRRFDERHDPTGVVRAAALDYRRPERVWTRRAAAAVVLALVLAAVPSAEAHPPTPRRVTGNPLLADTPLADVQVSGLLSPALVAARNYIRTYGEQTDTYYDALRAKLRKQIDDGALTLPRGTDGADATSFGFVTDRHCNTGMDRVTVDLMRRLGVTTLVSGGDDAFSGTFAFESACTRNLAQQSARADITDVVAAGNHDSERTVRDEAAQGMRTLTGDVVEVDGLRFLGSPDPRTSRYGEGIRPPTVAGQAAALRRQAEALAATACDDEGPLIVVAHDPSVGTAAVRDGCGRVTLALDGHTHAQAGPTTVTRPDGSSGEQFTGASAGGAPSENSPDRTFATSLTVGPLHNDAYVYVITVDRGTGRLVGVTSVRITPAQDITVTRDAG